MVFTIRIKYFWLIDHKKLLQIFFRSEKKSYEMVWAWCVTTKNNSFLNEDWINFFYVNGSINSILFSAPPEEWIPK